MWNIPCHGCQQLIRWTTERLERWRCWARETPVLGMVYCCNPWTVTVYIYNALERPRTMEKNDLLTTKSFHEWALRGGNGQHLTFHFIVYVLFGRWLAGKYCHALNLRQWALRGGNGQHLTFHFIVYVLFGRCLAGKYCHALNLRHVCCLMFNCCKMTSKWD